MKKILNVSEMKQVCGGANVSRFCATGQLLYSCITDYGNGITSKGSICSSSVKSAVSAVLDINNESNIKVTCR